MGGNALKQYGLNPRRINNEEYEEITKEVLQLLSSAESPFSQTHRVEAYRLKESHGDIDFKGLLKSPTGNWKHQLRELFGSSVSHHNDNTLSLDFKDVQIDLEAHETLPCLLANLHYCHYSPIGNIVGRMLKQVGLKWGVDGLSVPVKKETLLIGSIPITGDAPTLLHIAGMNPKLWEEGFQTQEEIFSYAASCPLFNQEIFRFENLNHINRKRDIKRPDYNAWLEFASHQQDKLTEQTKEKTTSDILGRLHSLAPHLEKEEQRLREENQKREEAKKILGGEDLQRLTGLKGRDLGNFVQTLTTSKGGKTNLYHWILSTPKKEIEREIMNLAKEETIN